LSQEPGEGEGTGREIALADKRAFTKKETHHLSFEVEVALPYWGEELKRNPKKLGKGQGIKDQQLRKAELLLRVNVKKKKGRAKSKGSTW